jgi:hypothetical protein
MPDSSTHARNGILRNPSGTAGGEGVVGRSHGFTGGYLDIPNAGILGIGGSRSRTVSLWVYARRFNHAGIFQFGISQPEAMWSLRTGTSPNRWRVELENSANNREFSFDGDNKWVHFAAVYDGSETRVYANGQLMENSRVRAGLRTANFNGRLGSYQVQPDFAFDGLLDEVRVASIDRHPDWIRAEWATVGDHAQFTAYQPLLRHDASAPVIVAQPRSRWLPPGGMVSLSVLATTPPDAPATFQWYHNGDLIPGANGNTLNLPSVWFGQAGAYHVKVSNAHGETESAVALLRLDVTATPGSWAGLTLDEYGWVDTPFFGPVLIGGSWVFIGQTEKWVYLPEDHVSAEGAWVYFPRLD